MGRIWPACARPSSLSGEGGPLIAVLDTAALRALAGADERSQARLRALRARTTDMLVPAAVLAEGVFTGHRGHDYHVGRLLEAVAVVVVDRALGLVAGDMRHAALHAGGRSAPSAVDAIVAAVADDRARRDDVTIVTSDPADIGLLASLGDNARRVTITAV